MTKATHLTTDVEDEVYCIPAQSWGHMVPPGDFGADDDSCSQCGAVLYEDVLAKAPADVFENTYPKEEPNGA